MTTHPLEENTWIRSKVPVGDSGDFNEREAPAGALGRIDQISPRQDGYAYSVVFYPSHISNYWDVAEIERDAEILPADHPDIPTAQAMDLTSAVADIVYSGEVLDNTVEAPGSVVSRIRAAAPSAGANAVEILEMIKDGNEHGITLGYAAFDKLAALVGVGDRLLEQEPAPLP